MVSKQTDERSSAKANILQGKLRYSSTENCLTGKGLSGKLAWHLGSLAS